jgi:hypothetical protein
MRVLGDGSVVLAECEINGHEARELLAPDGHWSIHCFCPGPDQLALTWSNPDDHDSSRALWLAHACEEASA